MVEIGPKEQKIPTDNSLLNQARGEVDDNVQHKGKS